MKDSEINFLINWASGSVVAFDMGTDDDDQTNSILEASLTKLVVANVPAELQAARILDFMSDKLVEAGYTEECANRNLKKHMPSFVSCTRYLTRRANSMYKIGTHNHNV